MAKPVNRKIWLFKCPKCGNNKLRYISYKDKEKYTCVKCDYRWEMSHENMAKGIANKIAKEEYEKSEVK